MGAPDCMVVVAETSPKPALPESEVGKDKVLTVAIQNKMAALEKILSAGCLSTVCAYVNPFKRLLAPRNTWSFAKVKVIVRQIKILSEQRNGVARFYIIPVRLNIVFVPL